MLVSPVELNVDQDALEFLVDFFTYNVSPTSNPPSSSLSELQEQNDSILFGKFHSFIFCKVC